MNRKSKAKLQKGIAADIAKLGPYDDPLNWLQSDFREPPWPQEKIREYQKRLDSAFGAENAIILAWSGDKQYGDAFYTDWFPNGLPKGKLERKPPLLFAEHKINENDYLYIGVPRWLLLEVHHGSQLEDSWADGAWVTDNKMLGGRKQIRASKPPEFFYVHLKVIARHETPIAHGLMPPCCERLMEQHQICYGQYRVPDESDIGFVRRIRENMDKAGVAQRNDTKRSAKLLEQATLATRHYIRRAQEQQALSTQAMMLEHPEIFLADIVKKKGSTMSLKEIREIAKEAFDEQNQERFGA